MDSLCVAKLLPPERLLTLEHKSQMPTPPLYLCWLNNIDNLLLMNYTYACKLRMGLLGV